MIEVERERERITIEWSSNALRPKEEESKSPNMFT